MGLPTFFAEGMAEPSPPRFKGFGTEDRAGDAFRLPGPEPAGEGLRSLRCSGRTGPGLGAPSCLAALAAELGPALACTASRGAEPRGSPRAPLNSRKLFPRPLRSDLGVKVPLGPVPRVVVIVAIPPRAWVASELRGRCFIGEPLSCTPARMSWFSPTWFGSRLPSRFSTEEVSLRSSLSWRRILGAPGRAPAPAAATPAVVLGRAVAVPVARALVVATAPRGAAS